MIRNIVRDVMFLSRPAEDATREDLPVARDLMDTLKANREGCVGMAANMIGINKRIIIVNMGPVDFVMFNPVIVSKETPYEAEEGCLSLDGVRKTTRYKKIEVEFTTMAWTRTRATYEGWIAEIIQHEIDHTNGIII